MRSKTPSSLSSMEWWRRQERGREADHVGRMMRLWSVFHAKKLACSKVLIFIHGFGMTQTFHVPNVKDCIHNHTPFNMRRSLRYGGDVHTISSNDVDRQDGIGCC